MIRRSFNIVSIFRLKMFLGTSTMSTLRRHPCSLSITERSSDSTYSYSLRQQWRNKLGRITSRAWKGWFYLLILGQQRRQYILMVITCTYLNPCTSWQIPAFPHGTNQPEAWRRGPPYRVQALYWLHWFSAESHLQASEQGHHPKEVSSSVCTHVNRLHYTNGSPLSARCNMICQYSWCVFS